MGFEEFIKEAQERMQDWLGGETQICRRAVRKNNGVVLTGLYDRNGGEVSPVLYMEPFYQAFTEAGGSREAFEETVEQIKEQYAAADRSGTVRELARSMGNFEAVKNRLSYRLVGREGNEELLRESPHKNFLDLAAVLELYIDAGDDGAYSIPVRNQHMEMWGADTEELFRLAERNTPVLKPPVLYGMREMLGLPPVKGEKEALHVLTNQSGIHGAAVMLYKGALQLASEKLGGDLLILPASVHELILGRWEEGLDLGKVQELVRIVNREEVERTERLSDHAYRYIQAEDRVEFLEE